MNIDKMFNSVIKKIAKHEVCLEKKASTGPIGAGFDLVTDTLPFWLLSTGATAGLGAWMLNRNEIDRENTQKMQLKEFQRQIDIARAENYAIAKKRK